MTNQLSIRTLLPQEYPLMEEFMYESIHQPDPQNPYPKEVIYYPQVKIYWDNWGQERDDYCLVALVENRVAGAVWIRTFKGELKGFGYVDEQTPEVAIGLYEAYRNQGIGTQMMHQIINHMKEKGFRQVSLSITKGNPAIRLYERLGFKTINENEEDFIMLMQLV